MRTVMKLRTFATLSLLLLTSLAVCAAPREKSNLEAIYDKAFREFDAEHYDEALKALDQIDGRQPDLAESLNLRGVVLMRQGKFDQAEKALRKAISLDPRFWNARYNLWAGSFARGCGAHGRNGGGDYSSRDGDSTAAGRDSPRSGAGARLVGADLFEVN
jgi:tetratricopeptide (TPR) repeat protein